VTVLFDWVDDRECGAAALFANFPDSLMGREAVLLCEGGVWRRTGGAFPHSALVAVEDLLICPVC